MSKTFQIRRCCAEDFHEVVLLLRQLWPDKPFDPASLRPIFEKGLLSDSNTYLCATDGKHLIAFGSLSLSGNLWPEGRLAYVDELVVDRVYRSKGIGAQLLERLVALARKQGCRRVELVSAFSRKQAHRFYERHGFTSRAFLFSMVL